MTTNPEQAAEKAEAAAQKADAAAKKAERAARRPGYLLGVGFLFALVGAVMAFALTDSDASVLGIEFEPLGGVLIAAGALLMAGGAIVSTRLDGGGGHPDRGSDANSIKTIGGLVAVLAGIIAVTAMALVTTTRLGSSNKESIVAVTSSAFGIISAVVGAYLGIKITADSSNRTNEEAKHAAVAQHEAALAKNEKSAFEESVANRDPRLAEEAKTAGQEKREEVVDRTIRPAEGALPQ